MSSLIRLNNKIILQNFIKQQIYNLNRNISTSRKNRETATISNPIDQLKSDSSTATSPAKKNWVSYGFNYKDEAEDRNITKSTFFCSVTLCIVCGMFIWSYLPDPQLRDWAQREGFLELRRREQAGLDLVNPNYVDPSKINLPSDEELGDMEIVI